MNIASGDWMTRHEQLILLQQAAGYRKALPSDSQNKHAITFGDMMVRSSIFCGHLHVVSYFLMSASLESLHHVMQIPARHTRRAGHGPGDVALRQGR